MMADQDLIEQAEAIRRRRALLQQINQGSMQAPIQGNLAQGLGQVLTKLGTTWLAKKGGEALDRETDANRGAYREQLGTELETFERRQQGLAPGLDPRLAEIAPGGLTPDARGAATSAMTSQFPEMQGIGKAAFADLVRQAKKRVWTLWSY